ncbi:hypothetical protein FHG87_015739 [Trinorchestia longiramus]|nr:hypothetical protein FHG87_015739 [Trinorchestia longiramus]
MSGAHDEEIPAAPPPPLVHHKLDEANQPLLMDHHAHIHHHHHPIQPVGVVDLEAGSKRRVKALAIAGMVAVLVAGVLKRFPITSGALALAVVLVFFLYSVVAALVLLLGSVLSRSRDSV